MLKHEDLIQKAVTSYVARIVSAYGFCTQNAIARSAVRFISERDYYKLSPEELKKIQMSDQMLEDKMGQFEDRMRSEYTSFYEMAELKSRVHEMLGKNLAIRDCCHVLRKRKSLFALMI